MQMGRKYDKEGNYKGAFEVWTKAVELVVADAHLELSRLYWKGLCVEKVKKKESYHTEEAAIAIAGHPYARHNLANYDSRFERAVKHLIIAANLGFDPSIQMLKRCYVRGLVSKEDFAAALRAHQAAVDATKSPQRERVPTFYNSKSNFN